MLGAACVWTKVPWRKRAKPSHGGKKVKASTSPNTQRRDQFKYNLAGSKPQVSVKGGTIQEAKAETFPVLQGGGLAIFLVVLKPGAVRIPHWHPDANELDYCLQGKAAVAIVPPDGEGHDQKLELSPGEISFIPQGWFHSITNVGPEELRVLVIFSNASPNDIGISVALAGMSDAVLGETLGVPPSTFKNFAKDVIYIAPQ
jgi:oxalate decarboxylase